MKNTLKESVIQMIYRETLRSGNPVFCIVDDTISSRTKPSSRALERWPIEVFFRQSKGRLAFDRYQIRSSKGIQRYWLLMSLAHFIACTSYGKAFPFEEGYAYFYRSLQEERITYVCISVRQKVGSSCKCIGISSIVLYTFLNLLTYSLNLFIFIPIFPPQYPVVA